MSDTSTTDQSDMARKIRALLDKAEATEFDSERDAFMEKAMSLMARYQISEAMVAASAPVADRGKIIERVVELGSGPYVRARLRLISGVGDSQSCQVLTAVEWTGRVAYIVGFPSDVARTEMLYTSLLVQATTEASRIKSQSTIATSSIRRSFLFGFASAVCSRLAAIMAAATWEYERETGTKGVALVLADRRQDVDDLITKRYGKLGTTARPQGYADADAHTAGCEAGTRADISGGRGVRATAAGSIGSGS